MRLAIKKPSELSQDQKELYQDMKTGIETNFGEEATHNSHSHIVA
jgi:hypothetical protein